MIRQTLETKQCIVHWFNTEPTLVSWTDWFSLIQFLLSRRVQSPGDMYLRDLFSCSQSRFVLLSNLMLLEAKLDEDLGDFHFQTVFKSTIKITVFSNPLNVIHYLFFVLFWGWTGGRAGLSVSMSSFWVMCSRRCTWRELHSALIHQCINYQIRQYNVYLFVFVLIVWGVCVGEGMAAAGQKVRKSF